jgi:prepilin peptidase CpaA
VSATLGLLTGLALFMPLYIFRAVGAGDVKLLAMVGVWLGPQFTLAAALLTLLAGGLLAIIVMLASRSSLQVLANVRMMLTSVMIGAHSGRLVPLDAPAEVSTRLPYALAIAVGSLAQVGWLLVQSSA